MRATTHVRWFLRFPVALALVLLADVWSASTAHAQGKKREVSEMTLPTADGLELAAVYYPSKKGKEAVPVLLLHGFGGSGADYKGLAETLQDAGHAVLVPDLRGHGGSTSYRGKKLDHKRMPAKMCHMMYVKGGDVEACKTFLVKENNAGRVNIEKLCVVGSGLGAAVAMNWSIVDWSWPRLGGYKQGQDVKALVLLSPPWTEKTVSVNRILTHPVIKDQLTLFILVGKEDRDSYGDAERMHRRLEAARGGTGAEGGQDFRLYFREFETKRQGTELLVPDALKVADRIAGFIDQKLVRETIPWAERKNPLASD